MSAVISPDFPFKSKYVDILGSSMHYIDEGNGDPVLFLHGNPTSSYLWRNVIPHVAGKARCIAPDLIGMGKSGKPDLEYVFQDHYRYIEGFIEALDLKNVTLVLHDWGSGLGFHYAAENPENVRGIAFMEAILRPLRWADFPPGFKEGFRMMRTPYVGWFLISVANFFVNGIMPKATVRKLSKEEMMYYRAPYPTIASRKPIRQWPLEIPIDGKPERMMQVVTNYSAKLMASTYPKLLLHADPGGLINEATVKWCTENLQNLSVADIGEGIHYVQEDNPERIGEAIAAWIDVS